MEPEFRILKWHFLELSFMCFIVNVQRRDQHLGLIFHQDLLVTFLCASCSVQILQLFKPFHLQ